MDGYTVRQIYPWLYSLCDPMGVFCYLAVGSKKALLYDTAYGIGSLTEAVLRVTDKPLTVVLGHGHVDHANGAHQFDEVYLHPDDFALFAQHTSKAFRQRIADGAQRPEGFDARAYIDAAPPRLAALAEGQVFDLGGLCLEVVAMPGHTAGSAGLLARQPRVLLDSDAANPHVWMFLEESLPLPVYAEMLSRVKRLDFDVFFVGHDDTPKPKSDFDKYLRVARNAAADKAKPYENPLGMAGLWYEEDGAGIAFSETKR